MSKLQEYWDAAPALAEKLAQSERAAKSELEDLRRDAMRYRWLAAHARSTAEHWGGRWSLVIDGPAPKRDDCEDALDDAIDAAMAEGKR